MKELNTYLAEFLQELWLLTTEMAPYLLLGFLFAGILHVFFPSRLVRKHMGGSDFKSSAKASLLGVPLPLCSCGVLPTGISFYHSGASRGSTVSFLISTPQTGVDSIIATYAMLGWPFAIVRPIVALFSGIAGGGITNLATRKERSGSSRTKASEHRKKRSFREMVRYGFVELMQDISKWLLIGLLIAALLAVVIPEDFFTETISSEILSMLLILVASIPLYVCATGSIPIAAVLLMKGLSPGAALVFLMAGPATNTASMAVIGSSLGRRTLWLYLVSIIGGALAFGLLINELIPRDWFMSALPDISGHGAHGHIPGWLGLTSAILLIGLMINGWLQKLVTRSREKKQMTNNKFSVNMKTYKVEGMTCNHCKATVEKGISELYEKGEVSAIPERNELIISDDDVSDDEVKRIIEKLGYSFKGPVR